MLLFFILNLIPAALANEAPAPEAPGLESAASEDAPPVEQAEAPAEPSYRVPAGRVITLTQPVAPAPLPEPRAWLLHRRVAPSAEPNLGTSGAAWEIVDVGPESYDPFAP